MIRGPNMPGELREEFLSHSVKEVDYFADLVEDLLFLAQATEPKYLHSPGQVKLAEILEQEIESTEKFGREEQVVIEADLEVRNDRVKGDSHLLRRLVRNALDNAIAFAKSRVTVKISNSEEGAVELTFQDDGPGFSEQALKEFGHRRPSRRYTSTAQRRASIGLGSVIMNTIVQLHRGALRAENTVAPGGDVVGARVTMSLPGA